MSKERTSESPARAASLPLASGLGLEFATAHELAGEKLARVGDEKLIKIDGIPGIFTPIASASATDAGSTQNLGQVVELLKREVSELRTKNLDLESRLRAALEKSTRTPDDFASAVKHSLDSLQTRLSETTNPVSNFVVREFSLEAKVLVDVSALGTIDYRFVQPGDAVDPNRLSKLALTIVPVPKPSKEGSFTASEFTPQTAVEEIQGVGDVWGKRLNGHGIYTVGDLVTAGARVKTKAELSALLQVDRERLADWLAQAELLTVRDIDGRGAELLARTGVAGLDKLAAEEPEALADRFNAENAKKREGKAAPIDASTAKVWIDTARAWVGKRPTAPIAPPKSGGES